MQHQQQQQQQQQQKQQQQPLHRPGEGGGVVAVGGEVGGGLRQAVRVLELSDHLGGGRGVAGLQSINVP